MSNSQSPDWLSAIKCLPVLPHDVHRLINVFADDKLDYKAMAEVLAAHQSISSRLLMLANSAWINTGVEVTSIEQACFKLGLDIVRGVSIGLAVMKPFNVAFCPAFDLKRYWVTSMLVADGASILANQMPTAEREPHFAKTVHTAGILHNIGLLCLADLKPKQTHNILKSKMGNLDTDLSEAFRKELNTDYCEAGGILASSWGLPQVLVSSIQYHRSPNYNGSYRECAILVGVAAQWVSSLFRHEPIMLSTYLEQQSIDVARQQAAFSIIESQFRKTVELADTLFH